MIKSMTGYGRAEKMFDEYKLTIDIKTVNNRYLDCNIKLYKQYLFLEDTVRKLLSDFISRGKVDVFIQFDNVADENSCVVVNEEIARGYYNALCEISDMFDIKNDISAVSLARFQDVLTLEKNEQDKDKLAEDLTSVLTEALHDLTKSRSDEGARLVAFFDETISTIRETLEIIKEKAPETVNEYKEKLKDRINEMLSDAQVDEMRLMTEVAIFADRVNITEEITRFESHLVEFDKLIKSDVPVGRKLDFLVQELNREVNTMGSKCNDIEISKCVVELKSLIEKIREQIQNIE